MTDKKNVALILSFAAIFISLFQACGPAKPGIYKVDQINPVIAGKLHGLNTDFLDGLKRDDQEQLENMMSQELIDDRHNRLRIAELINKDMKHSDYSLMTEYYIVNQFDKGTDIIHERDKGINNFDLTFNRGAREMYIALFTNKNSPQKYMITTIYCKYSYGWKIALLEYSTYAENGKTAPELMQQAQEQLKNGYWLDASNNASLAVHDLKPSAFWKYVNEDTITKFQVTALKAVMSHYKLPLTITDVPSHPRIWRIRFEKTPEGAFPDINYISSIKLLDTVALKSENQQVGKVIGKVMAGVDKDKKYIYYTIYNQTKDGIPFRDHYDLRQKLQ